MFHLLSICVPKVLSRLHHHQRVVRVQSRHFNRKVVIEIWWVLFYLGLIRDHLLSRELGRHTQHIGVFWRRTHTFGGIRGWYFNVEMTNKVVQIFRPLFPVPLIKTCPLQGTLTRLVSGPFIYSYSIGPYTGVSIDHHPLFDCLLLDLHLLNETLHELLVIKHCHFRRSDQLVLSDYIVQLLIHLPLWVEVLHQHLPPPGPVVVTPAQAETLGVHLVSAES